MERMKPGRLKQGDQIGIIAPASPPDRENLERSLSFLEQLGLQAVMGKHVYDQKGYLAGVDENRLSDLHEMFLNGDIKAIFCACGGYGTARIAAKMDYEMIRENPKIFWGYSDITFLHTSIRQKTGLVTFHGPMLASDFGKEDADELSKQYVSQLFEPGELRYPQELSKLKTVVSGTAEGELIGGNLCLLTSTLGTAFEVDMKDKLLLLEDIHEEPRNVDRMLNQLQMAGKLDEAAGFIIGDFNDCEPKRDLSLTLDEVIDHYIQKANKPAVKGFKIGHCSPHFSVPLGVNAVLQADQKEFIIENGVI